MGRRIWKFALASLALAPSCSGRHSESDANAGGAGGAEGVAGAAGSQPCAMVLEDHDGDHVFGPPHCSADGKPQSEIVLRRGDCDDENPATYRLAYSDHDADGFGAGGGTCVGDSIPLGSVLDDSDCNDADPGIHPNAAEQWSDALDSDCDGKDDPFSCSQSPDLCGCPALAAPPRPVSIKPSCQGADLSIRSAEQCFVCEDPSFASVVLENAGTQAAQHIELELELNGRAVPGVVISGELAAGAASKPLNVRSPPGQLVIRARTSTPDCDPNNDSFPLLLTLSKCNP